MLSLRRCREILGPACCATDSQLELLRDQLMAIADIALVMGRERLGSEAASAFDEKLKSVPAEQREEIAERAAIIEIDGGLPRVEAEEAALQTWVRAMQDAKSECIN